MPSTDTTGLNQSQYNFNSRVFPEDLASDYMGHYIVININVPTNYFGQARGYYMGNNVGSATVNMPSTLLSNLSKVDALKNSNTIPVNTSGFRDAPNSEQWAISRGTRRIAESIALFMPSQVMFTSENRYEEVSLTAFGARTLAAGVGLAGGAAARTAGGAAAIGTLMGYLGGAARTIGKASALMGYPINPRLEVLYGHTPQRQFVMEFLMAPKNENESKSVKQIIDTIRFHAAPEIDTLLGIIPSFIPPSEFDITFFNKGVENTKIPRINTCVLERCEVDYAPTGGIYSTFNNGYPVAIRLSLAFRETEILHKRRVLQGF